MFLRKITSRKTGRTYLSIVHGYWDKKSNQSRTSTIKSLGYLDELKKEFDDPIAHFEKIVAQMNEEQKANGASLPIQLNTSEQLAENSSGRKNFGYAAASKVYHELKLDNFWVNRSRRLNLGYSPNNVMKLMVFSQLLEPCSKRKAYENKDRYFENTDFSLDHMYIALAHINKHRDTLQSFMYEHIKEQYVSSTEIVYYYVTDYCFEIDEPDELRRKGLSKEYYHGPFVQMGLLMDMLCMPIACKLFNGNDNDCAALMPLLKQIRTDFNLERVIVVADKRVNTSDNINSNLKRKDGYVMSHTIRGAGKEFKEYVLKEEGYTWYGDKYKRKSRLFPREITVMEDGKKFKRIIDEKQVIFYSKDSDRRAKAERELALQKARELIKNPQKFNKANCYEAAKYVKNLHFHKDTGQIITATGMPMLNEEKVREEEILDGYCAIVTSESKEPDDRIIEIYRGLSSIEESFKVIKSDLECKPAYLSREDYIQSHFLVCFIALAIARILQHKVNNKYSVSKILESLGNISCSHIQKNYYLFDYRDEVTDAIGAAMNIDFSRKFMQLGDIKKFLGGLKKG